MFYHKEIPLNPEDFYCKYIPIEAFLDYVIALIKLYKNY
jgi:hypothetical protein